MSRPDRHRKPSERITTRSRFGPSREWHDLPVVGGGPDLLFRARFWRIALPALALFWMGVVWLAIALPGG